MIFKRLFSSVFAFLLMF